MEEEILRKICISLTNNTSNTSQTDTTYSSIQVRRNKWAEGEVVEKQAPHNSMPLCDLKTSSVHITLELVKQRRLLGFAPDLPNKHLNFNKTSTGFMCTLIQEAQKHYAGSQT
jgi:hypothetical protein